MIAVAFNGGPGGSGGTGGSGSSSTTSFERATKTLDTTRDIIQQMGWTGLGQSIIGTIALMAAFGFGGLINAIFNLPIVILEMFATLIPGINEATIGGLAGLFAASFDAGVSAFGTGWLQFLGIFQTPLGIFVGLLSLWEILYFMDVIDTDVLGAVVDLPDWILNTDDSGVADEDE